MNDSHNWKNVTKDCLIYVDGDRDVFRLQHGEGNSMVIGPEMLEQCGYRIRKRRGVFIIEQKTA